MCYPLTLEDGFSRYLLACQDRRSVRGEQSVPIFEEAFRTYGLPDRIRSDNGPPFGTNALCGLSRLAVWWLKLGISVERITPGRPQENGRHERMHRTLKAEATVPPAATPALQQARFDAFRDEYNAERPHEALGGLTPAEVYRSSWRPHREETPGLDYPGHYERRQVRAKGTIKWRGEKIFISEVLAGEPVGLVEVAEDAWAVYFCSLQIGTLSEGQFNKARTKKDSPAAASPAQPAQQNV